jgi:hypothetical protein
MFPARYRQEKTYNNDGSGRHGGGFALCDYHATELYLALKGAFATEKPKMIEPTVVNRGLEPGLEYYVEMTPVEGLLL